MPTKGVIQSLNLLDRIEVVENRQEVLVRGLQGSDRPLVIYGAGVYAYVLHTYLKARGIQVSKLAVDRRYLTEKNFLDLEIVAIEDLFPVIDQYQILIGIANYPAVQERFTALGYQNIHPFDVPDFLNIPQPFMDYNFVRQHSDKFQRAWDCFDDQLSRDTYIAAINTKINQDLSYIRPYVHVDHLYFATGEFPLSNKEFLLDVGGFNGDSVRDFDRVTKGHFKRIISLEPFPKMFEQLQATISELSLTDKVAPVQLGAWNEKTRLYFSNTELDIDSKVREDGEFSIEVDTIDNIVADLEDDVTLIKIDINGAEYNALRGAVGTIRRCRPGLALKMHVKEDFYRVPLFLKEIAPEMKLHLRQRNFMSMMLVLYGTF